MHPWGSSACGDGKDTHNTYFLGQSDCEHHIYDKKVGSILNLNTPMRFNQYCHDWSVEE